MLVLGDGALDVSVANGGSHTGAILLGGGAGGLGALRPKNESLGWVDRGR